MSRVDVKEDVPNPNTAERYAIIRSSLIELQRCGKIKVDGPSELNDHTQSDDDLQPDDLVRPADSVLHDEEGNTGLEQDDTADEEDSADEDNISVSCGDRICGHVYIPIYGETLFSKPRSDKLIPGLEELCRRSDGMSGRELRRLPVLAVSMYLRGQQHFLHEVLTAIEQVVKETARKGHPNGP